MGLTAREVVDLFEKDESARKRLAELLVSEPDVRLAIINAVLRDVATKSDIQELRKELKGDINELRGEISELRKEISDLRKEMSSNFRWTIGVIITVWGATAIPILLKLAGLL